MRGTKQEKVLWARFLIQPVNWSPIVCIRNSSILLRFKILTNFLFFSFQILLKIGISVYEALDFNLPQDEECILSQDLHDLISLMTFEGN